MDFKKKVDSESERNEVLNYAISGLAVAILIIVSTGGRHGWLAILLWGWITWLKWKRVEWREEQCKQGIDPDAEWRPWKLKAEEEAKKQSLEK